MSLPCESRDRGSDKRKYNSYSVSYPNQSDLDIASGSHGLVRHPLKGVCDAGKADLFARIEAFDDRAARDGFDDILVAVCGRGEARVFVVV